uniref:Uncharacterized protein n=1 Tax=Timema genevievae TaxID=629358 RepID=A0A7R9K2K0_TIMGE|nr:unnamed protein product [Timema genevievae]
MLRGYFKVLYILSYQTTAACEDSILHLESLFSMQEDAPTHLRRLRQQLDSAGTLAEEIRGQFIEGDQLIGCVKKVLLMAPSQVASFKSEAPNVPLPPAPILTRGRGDWIEACNYYCENFQVVKNIDSFDSNEATSIKVAQELLFDPEIAAHPAGTQTPISLVTGKSDYISLATANGGGVEVTVSGAIAPGTVNKGALVPICALEAASVLPTHRNWEDDFDKTISKAQAEVDKIKVWIDDQSQQLQTKATASVQDVFKNFDDALEQAQEKGATMGIDVSSCVDGKKETVDSEVQELVQAAFACATNELDSALDLASNLLNQIETIKNKVVEIAADFEDCNHKNKLKKAECIAKETGKAVEQAAKVEIDVSGFISKETLLFEELAPKLLACEAVQVNAAEQEATQLASDLENRCQYTHDETQCYLELALKREFY